MVFGSAPRGSLQAHPAQWEDTLPRARAEPTQLLLHLPPLKGWQSMPDEAAPQGQPSPEEGGQRVGAVPGPAQVVGWAGHLLRLCPPVPDWLAHHFVLAIPCTSSSLSSRSPSKVGLGSSPLC